MTATTRSTATQTARSGQRADLQGLRALAVLLVVVFHAWPDRLPGGYVGVDVFFVISGFLITGHLVREVDRTGTVSLARFWARRVRRLLPAALTVLIVTACSVWFVAPAGAVGRFVTEVMASALYLENVVLAGRSVDYLAAEEAPSPVQHFWSLSAEEQFYLAWPLLILATVALGRTVGRTALGKRPTLAIGAILALVVTASLTWSILYTARDPAPAYFLATTRAWEFGAGGLLALTTPWLADRCATGGWERRRAALAWLGLGSIGLAAALYRASTPFPGAAALLPVLGTLAVIAAAEPGGRFAPTRMLTLRPAQRLGDLSYGVYLWHWPLFVLIPYGLGRELAFADAVVVIGATVALAAATERWVENPVRNGRLATRPPLATFAAMAAGMVAVVALPLSTLDAAHHRVAVEQERIEDLVDERPGCLGAAAVDSTLCLRVEPAAAMIADPSLAEASPERCIAGIREAELTVCAYGAEEGTGRRSIALIGDSHAEQWLPAFADLAAGRDWTLFVLAKSSCPFGPERRFEENMSDETLAEMNKTCTRWNEDARDWLGGHPEVDTVFTATRARNPVVAEDGDDDWRDTAARQYRDTWAVLPGTIAAVIVLRDTPRMGDDVLACVSGAGEEAQEACAVDSAEALDRDPAVDAATGSADPRVRVIDLTRYFCPDGRCRPVIGGVLAYRDSHHISWVYAKTLAPFLGEEIDALSAG